jgi:hypothetical protein
VKDCTPTDSFDEMKEIYGEDVLSYYKEVVLKILAWSNQA